MTTYNFVHRKKCTEKHRKPVLNILRNKNKLRLPFTLGKGRE